MERERNGDKRLRHQPFPCCRTAIHQRAILVDRLPSANCTRIQMIDWIALRLVSYFSLSLSFSRKFETLNICAQIKITSSRVNGLIKWMKQ